MLLGKYFFLIYACIFVVTIKKIVPTVKFTTHIAFFIIIFLCSLNLAKSQNYAIFGNNFVSKEQILNELSNLGNQNTRQEKVIDKTKTDTTQGIILNKDSILTTLYSLYHSFGFFDCEIKAFEIKNDFVKNDSVKNDSVKNDFINKTNYRIEIVENERYLLQDILITSDTLAKKNGRIFEVFNKIKNLPYNYNTLQNLINTTLLSLDSLAYPLAKCKIEEFIFPHNPKTFPTNTDSMKPIKKVIIKLTYSNLFPIKISEFNFTGNKETNSNLIKMASGVTNEENFRQMNLPKIRANIARLNIFRQISMPELYATDSGKYGLGISFVENNSNLFDGVLGVAPSATESGTNIFGSVKITLKNMFGTGRNLIAKWESLQNSTSELYAEYQEPFIFNLPFNAYLVYSQIQNPANTALTSYVQRNVSLHTEYFTNENLSLSVGTNFLQTIPQPDSLLPCYKQLIRSNLLSLEAMLKYDSRNNRINPIFGMFFSTAYSFGFVNYTQSEKCFDSLLTNTGRQKIDVNFSYFENIYKSIVGLGSLNFGSLIGEQSAQESELYNFGGQATVRGYKENQFRADRRVWSNIELRILLNDLSYIGFFYDTGYFLRNANPFFSVAKSETFLYGYGFTSQIETALGLVRFSFALGKDDKFDTGKIFFGLVSDI